MADPRPLDRTAVHPCKDCNGARHFTHFEWRSPAYWIECRHCHCVAVGETEAEALATWNDANPPRELALEDELVDIEAVKDDLQRRHANIHTLCEHDTHVAHKMPSGTYVCVQCGLQFREHHEIEISVGMGSRGRAVHKE